MASVSGRDSGAVKGADGEFSRCDGGIGGGVVAVD